MCEAFASLIFSTKHISVFSNKVVKHLTSWPLNELVKLTMLWTTGPRRLCSWYVQRLVPTGTWRWNDVITISCVYLDGLRWLNEWLTILRHFQQHFSHIESIHRWLWKAVCGGTPFTLDRDQLFTRWATEALMGLRLTNYVSAGFSDPILVRVWGVSFHYHA